MAAAKSPSVQLNGDYEELTKFGYNYVEGTLVPQIIPRSHITLTELRNAIPPHCFQRSLKKSFGHLALDLSIVSALFYFGYTLLEQLSLPFHFQLVGYSIYWLLQGTFLTSLWVIAHECGHGAFCESEFVSDLVGLILHSALLVPYHSWKITHRKHHSNTGSCENDQVFLPFTRKTAWTELLEDTPFHQLVKIILILVVGWPAYLTVNMWGPKKYRKVQKCHFNPYAAFFSPKERLSIVLSDTSFGLFVLCLGYFASTYGFGTVMRLYIIPYVIVNAYLVTVTYLHHTDVYVPHYREPEWTWLRGSLCTVDRSYGKFLDVVLHHITDTHICHHFFSKILFYHCVEATEAIKPILGKYYLSDSTPIYSALQRVVKNCKYVDRDGNIVFYKK